MGKILIFNRLHLKEKCRYADIIHDSRIYLRINTITSLEKNQIRTLFSQAIIANLAILFAGVLVWGTFLYSDVTMYMGWFISVILLATSFRLLLVYNIQKNGEKHLIVYSHYYVVASFLLGLDFSLLSIAYYDLDNNDLRIFLTIVNLGLITAAVGTLSVWLRAYLAFALPQIAALIIVFILNDSPSVVVATIVFSWFMLTIAKNFNLQFKKGRSLIDENIKLISEMQTEITNRKKAQIELENHQKLLEQTVNERTKELKTINESLNDQIGIRRIVEKQLEYLAYYDELTELPNRSLFIEELKRSLLQAKRNQSLLGILFIDLDRFKTINDSYGHYIGDKLLKSVADRLKNLLRDSDTIARNSGDEFIICLENMHDAREPFVVSNKIIESLNKKFDIEGHVVHIGVSIGISMYPLDGDDALELIKMSDTALYEAKNIGRNNFQFYSNAMSSKITDRLNLENALRKALDNNEFFLVYQPQVDLHTQQTTGFEALIRWNSPEFGVVSPFKFIPVLEETGLIYSVGEWIIEEVLRFIKSGKNNNTKVSINLSALQCGVNNFSHKIEGFINEACIEPELVEFEITESVLIDDFSQTQMFLSDISNLGCTIALDDFGTGYTSFEYLTKLPIDVIKIDRSLITGIHENKNLQDIVRAIITMSESLGIENVFEGVETLEELKMVEQIHGVTIQGFYFSKPLEQHQVEQWFSSNSRQSVR